MQTSKERSAEERRKFIENKLASSSQPLTASYFAKELSVSRQIIVGDVAILRASGLDILATSRGYMLNASHEGSDFPFTGIVACNHTAEQLREELYIIVDFGATIIDVVIEHAIYGELSGKLDVSSRHDADLFVSKVESSENSAPISTLTGGVHIHHIGCRDEATFELIKSALDKKGILIN